MPIDEHRAANRANWDDRVPIHWGADGYDAEGFAADPEALSMVVVHDRDRLGDVAGKTLLHLQCHIGKDTMSWARLGARVTGIDFSEPAIEAARRLADLAGIDARFILSEVYDSPGTLDEQFDIVYTGVGAICWLPDISGWARVIAHFLAPGGTFFMREGHPVLWGLDWREDGMLVHRFPYFEVTEPVSWDDDATYAGTGKVAHTRTYEWNHGIGEVYAALTNAGLRVTSIEEHRELEWQGLPQMTRDDDGWWRLPEEQRDLVPLMWSIAAVKPAG
jgi:SAM-dependent methyltransferase